jgi:hypothetical protein
MDAGCRASNIASSSPISSRMLELRPPSTAAPLFIASSTGRPNPSYNEGNTNASQAL